MSNQFDLNKVDASGDLRTMAADAGALDAPIERRAMLRKAALAGGGVIVAGGLFEAMLTPAEAAISKKRKSKANDVKILNYALTLEYLEAAFYAQGNANKAWKDAQYQKFAELTGKHEAEHVVVLKKVLGKASVKEPEFAFGAAVTDPATFAAVAQVLEDTGVAAYAGQVANVQQRPVLEAAAAIHSVEARHAAWIRFLTGGGAVGATDANAPAPESFDAPKTEGQVLHAVRKTGFVPGL